MKVQTALMVIIIYSSIANIGIAHRFDGITERQNEIIKLLKEK